MPEDHETVPSQSTQIPGGQPAASQRPQKPKAQKPVDYQAKTDKAVRKAVDVTSSMWEADVPTRATLAAVLGCASDPRALAAAAVSMEQKPPTVGQVLLLASQDPMEAGVSAAAAEKADLKAMHGLLVAIGALSGRLPAVDVKAALGVAKAAFELTSEQRAKLQSVDSLIAKI